MHNAIVNFLARKYPTQRHLETLVSRAFLGYPTILAKIDLSGNSAQAVMDLVSMLWEHGQTHPGGVQALWHLLLTAREDFGPDVQAQIDNFKVYANKESDLREIKSPPIIIRKPSENRNLFRISALIITVATITGIILIFAVQLLNQAASITQTPTTIAQNSIDILASPTLSGFQQLQTTEAQLTHSAGTQAAYELTATEQFVSISNSTATAAQFMATETAAFATLLALSSTPTPVPPTPLTNTPSPTKTYTPSATPTNTLTPSSTPTLTPSPTPQNGMIAFVSSKEGNDNIYVMNSDGSVLKLLTHDDGSNSFPSWSPNGKAIAFTSDRNGSGNQKIFIMAATGVILSQVTKGYGIDNSPKWSPDGTKIVFSSNRSGIWELYTVSQTGDDLKYIRTGMDLNYNPAWSPDGRQIVFEGQTEEGNRDVYVMDINGNNLRQLTTNPGIDQQPAWSPDGKKILFVSDRYGNEDIYVMYADGSFVYRLTITIANENMPAWSPDGKQMAFISQYGGVSTVYTRSISGGTPKPIFSSQTSVGYLSWQAIP